jgi:hypothetical protein
MVRLDFLDSAVVGLSFLPNMKSIQIENTPVPGKEPNECVWEEEEVVAIKRRVI